MSHLSHSKYIIKMYLWNPQIFFWSTLVNYLSSNDFNLIWTMGVSFATNETIPNMGTMSYEFMVMFSPTILNLHSLTIHCKPYGPNTSVLHIDFMTLLLSSYVSFLEMCIIPRWKPNIAHRYFSTMKNCVHRNHTTLQLKIKKQFVYNYCATIPWVLQLMCNYPFKNMVY
jgi:hypothetical protein